MASIRKRAENSYLIVVSMGYDYQGKRKKPVQKTVHPPEGLTPRAKEKWLNEQALLFEREVKSGPEPKDRSITFAAYVEHWKKDIMPEKLSVSTQRRAQQDLQRILPELGRVRLTELDRPKVREFCNKMRKSPSAKGGIISERTVSGIHSTLCGILSDAVEEGYIRDNPAWRAFKPKTKRKDIYAADEEQARQLIEALEQCSIKHETFYKLVLATGMRRGEACGLTWSDIDWREQSVHIHRNVVKVSHMETVVKEPKTRAGDRVDYLSPEMISLLREYRAFCEDHCLNYSLRPLSEEDFLFRRDNGQPMTPNSFTYRFKLILKKYGLPPQLTIHSLRHTCASLQIAHGVDVRTVASNLGHSQTSTTLDIYAHAFDKQRRESQKTLEDVLGI